jgi:hypothetical protein
MIKESTSIWIWNIVTYITIIWILLFVGIIILLVQDLKKRKVKKAIIHHASHTQKHSKKTKK